MMIDSKNIFLALFRRISLAMFAVLFMTPAQAQFYELGAGDKVHITVYKHPDLETIARIRDSGTISFPLLGEVSIGGLREADAEKKIATSLDQGGFVNGPQVGLTVDEYRSRVVAVLGHVNKPGQYALNRASTVVDLVAVAGGVSESGADYAVITKAAGNSKQIARVNLLDVLQRGDSAQNIAVNDGDIIFVPLMDQIYVYGAVQRSGAFRLQPNMTVLKAITVAGGLYLDNQRRQGSESRIEIVRRNAKGEAVTLDAKLEDIVQADDLIRIKETLF